MKRMAVQGEIKRYDLTELRNLTRAFNMIGTELNQIAKVANSTGQVTAKAMEEVKHQQDVLKKMMDKYLKQLQPNEVL